MDKSTLKGIETFLKIEGDCTVRLLNRNVPTPKKYVFTTLLFDGNIGLWAARFVDQNMEHVFQESDKEFSKAKQKLFKEVGDYISKGYKITSVISCFYIPPWLRKRGSTFG